jgi:hypothetical protein
MSATAPALPDEAQALVDFVKKRHGEACVRHDYLRKRWEKWYRLYRSRQDFKRTYASTQPRDVDEVLNDARSKFGADLFIPYVYSVIETTVPKLLANNPKMNLTPAPVHESAVPNMDLTMLEEHADTLSLVFDRAQTKMRYPVTSQVVAKSGLIYGLGVGKMCWHTEWKRSQPRVERALVHQADGPEWVTGRYDKMVYDGPKAEALDIFDWLPDPNMWEMSNCGFAIDRRWRSADYIKQMLATGAWELPAGVDLEMLLSQGNDQARDELWKMRMEAGGYVNAGNPRRGEHLHEVWEYHDGEDVITVIDGAVPVQAGPNPYWHGDLPFTIYRPTIVPHELCGIGEPEAVEDLQEEMNALRSQRRDNANLVLQRPFAYFDGLVNVDDVVFGPGMMIPTDADPKDVLFPIPLQDIPASSYQEEIRLQGDIMRVTGINDMESGAGDAGQQTTATGAQLVHAAANVRIANKTMLLVAEHVGPQAEMMLALYQQKVTSTTYVAGPPKPGDGYAPWRYYVLSPETLMDDWLIEADGGAMAAENTPQNRDDATRLFNMFGQDPNIRPDLLRGEVLRKMGIKEWQKMIVPQEPRYPQHVVAQALQQLGTELHAAGADPAAFVTHAEQVLDALNQADQQAQGQGAPAAGAPGAGAAPGQLGAGPVDTAQAPPR